MLAAMSRIDLDRRVVLRLIAAGVLAPGGDALVSIAGAQTAPDDYAPEFFSAEQMRALDRLTEIIIPADDHSPGASAALVNRYIDVMAADGSNSQQRAWRDGLDAVEAEAQRRYKKAFADLKPRRQEKIVAVMAAGESDPQTPLERFFRTLKRMTVDGYYTSEVGIKQDLRYEGNTAVAEFAGCTHPEHQA